jgi:hypothetical protein
MPLVRTRKRANAMTRRRFSIRLERGLRAILARDVAKPFAASNLRSRSRSSGVRDRGGALPLRAAAQGS